MNFAFRQFIRTYASTSSCKPKTPKSCKPKRGKAVPKIETGTECIVGPSGVYPSEDGGADIWRNISLFVCIPILIVAYFHVFGHPHEEVRPKFIKYEYMYRRTRKYPWGNDKTLFHNPKLNALPDGYEDDDC